MKFTEINEFFQLGFKKPIQKKKNFFFYFIIYISVCNILLKIVLYLFFKKSGESQISMVPTFFLHTTLCFNNLFS